MLSGSVTNARGLTSAGHGDATLTVTSANSPATVLLDYGVEVEAARRAVPRTEVERPSTPGRHASRRLDVRHVADPHRECQRPTWAPPSPRGREHAGAITGDSAFQPRAVSLTVSADGTLSSGFMGGFRFEAITLTTPGTVVLRGAGLQFGGGYLATAADYQGYFLSSSKAFNTMFYDGAYTEQTDMQPAGTSGATQPSVLDGAKRDRAIWSGDLKIEGQGIADTLGTNGDNYVKQSLLTLITSSQQGGGLNADTLFRTGPYSNSYSSWTLDAADHLLPQHRRHRLRPADPALAGRTAGLQRDPDRRRRADRHRLADIDHQRRLRLGLLRRSQDRHGDRVQRVVLPVAPRRRLHRG